MLTVAHFVIKFLLLLNDVIVLLLSLIPQHQYVLSVYLHFGIKSSFIYISLTPSQMLDCPSMLLSCPFSELNKSERRNSSWTIELVCIQVYKRSRVLPIVWGRLELEEAGWNVPLLIPPKASLLLAIH